jgi:NAD-dependent deacetylase
MNKDRSINEKTFRETADQILQSCHSVVFTGPGIFASSSPHNILGDSPLSFSFFPEDESDVSDNPGRLWSFYNPKRQTLAGLHPTPAHYALVEMESLMEKFILITQNIDGLHQKAGTKQLVELHGNLWRTYCRCSHFRRIDDGPVYSEKSVCPQCGGELVPDVIIPGNPVSSEDFSIAREACEQCDLLLCIGLTLETKPTSLLALQAKASGATLIEISTQPTCISHIADLRIQSSASETLPKIVSTLKESLNLV